MTYPMSVELSLEPEQAYSLHDILQRTHADFYLSRHQRDLADYVSDKIYEQLFPEGKRKEN